MTPNFNVSAEKLTTNEKNELSSDEKKQEELESSTQKLGSDSSDLGHEEYLFEPPTPKKTLENNNDSLGGIHLFSAPNHNESTHRITVTAAQENTRDQPLIGGPNDSLMIPIPSGNQNSK